MGEGTGEALLYRVYGWDEDAEEIWTQDNTEFLLGELRVTHVGCLNQLIDEGRDTDRLHSVDNYLGIQSVGTGLTHWTGSSDANVEARRQVGTEFVRLEGMQFYTPAWRTVQTYALLDPDFPSASPIDLLDETQRDLVLVYTQHERRRMEIARKEYLEKCDRLGVPPEELG